MELVASDRHVNTSSTQPGQSKATLVVPPTPLSDDRQVTRVSAIPAGAYLTFPCSLVFGVTRVTRQRAVEFKLVPRRFNAFIIIIIIVVVVVCEE